MQQTSISQDWSDYNEPTKSNILVPDLIASPCKNHPSFDGPCPRLNDFKDHPACENCGPRQIGFADCWNPLTYIPHPITQQTPNSKMPLSECDMPGCERMTKYDYCSRCTSRRNNRKGQWKRAGEEGEAPEWFLNRTPDRDFSKQPGHRSYDYHPDDLPYRPIIGYKSRLKRANELGYTSFKEMAIKLYAKHGSLRIAGKEIGISAQGLSIFLKKLGVQLKKPGYPNK